MVGFSMACSRDMAPASNAIVKLLPDPGMPNHADASVTGVHARFLARFIPAVNLRRRDSQLRFPFCRPQGFIHRNPNGVELVVAGHLLDQLATAVVVKDHKVPQQRQDSFWMAGPFQESL